MPAPLPLCSAQEIRDLPLAELTRLNDLWWSEFHRTQESAEIYRDALAEPMPGVDRRRIEALLDEVLGNRNLADDRISLYTAEIIRRQPQPRLLVELDEAAPASPLVRAVREYLASN
jgi:hypothetical protein